MSNSKTLNDESLHESIATLKVVASKDPTFRPMLNERLAELARRAGGGAAAAGNVDSPPIPPLSSDETDFDDEGKPESIGGDNPRSAIEPEAVMPSVVPICGPECKSVDAPTLKGARSCIAMGLSIIPVRARTKKPVEKNWQKSPGITDVEAPQFWGGPTPCNIGVLLRDGLVDIDGDWLLFNPFVDLLLPSLPVYGRPGAPRSHRLVRCEHAPKATQKLALPPAMSGDQRLPKDHQLCISEIRTTAQSVIPPGIHESGEIIAWDPAMPSEIPVMDFSDVEHRVKLATFAAVMAQLFPGVGVRCDFMMAIAGALAHAGIDAETIQVVVQLIGHLNGDEGDSGRWNVAAARGIDRVENEQEVTGLPTIGKILNLPPATLDFLSGLLGLGRASEDPDFVALNEKHAVVIIGGKTRILKEVPSTVHPGCTEYVFQLFDDFAHAYSNRWKSWVTEDGETKRVPLAKWWLAHRKRRQYLGGIAYMPKHDTREVGDVLNLWTGFSVKPVKGDCTLFLAHIRDVICSGISDHYDYFIKWMATIVQKRIRTGIAPLLRSDEEGTGKGFCAENFGHLLGQHYQQLNNPEQILGKFNDHLQRLSLVNADEAFFVGDPRHRNALFGLITERKFNVEPKGCGVFEAINHMNFIITTNAKHAIPAGPTARRFFALNVSNCRVGDTAYFDAMEDQLSHGGYEALLYHLLYEVDLTDFDVRKVPKTAALKEQAAYSRKGIDALIETVAHAAWLPHQHNKYPNIASTKGDKRGDGFWGWARDNFPELSRHSPHAFARDLRTWGCTTWSSGGPHIQFLSDISELRGLFDSRHGPQDWSADPTKWVRDRDAPGVPLAAPSPKDTDDLPF